MGVLIPHQKSFFFSSSALSGAENVSADGSRFQVTLNNPLQIPRSSMYATLEVEQASIWYVTPNITVEFGNNLFQFTTANAGNPGLHTITITDGLYSLEGLASFLNVAFSNLGLPSNLIVLSGDDATQSTVLTYLEAGDFADFTIANSCREILGFDAVTSPNPLQGAGYSDYSQNPAAFNRVNSYAIRSNIVSEGIPINNTAAGILVSVPIPSTVPPGSQISYQPQSPTKVDCRELIGQTKLNFSFELVDQLLRPTPTQGEIYTFIITFRFATLLTDKRVPMLAQ